MNTMLMLALFRFAILYFALLLVLIGSIMDLFHVLRQETEAFLIVNKLSKGFWIGIFTVCIIISFLFLEFSDLSTSFSTGTLFIASIAGIAIMTYWVEVRPKVNEIRKNNPGYS